MWLQTSLKVLGMIVRARVEMAGEQPVPDGVIGLGLAPRRTCLTFLLLPAERMVQGKLGMCPSTAGLKLDGRLYAACSVASVR